MGGPEREEPKFVLLCKLVTLLALGKVEGAVEELRLGKAEESEGKPIELDKGERDKGPNKDKLELGKIEGKDKEYHSGNELEAKGIPLELKGNAKGVSAELSKGKALDKLSYKGRIDEGPKLLAGLDKGKEGREELFNKGVKLDCKLLPKEVRGAKEGAKELLNKGSKELVKGTNNKLEGPELG